jgi:hypothetical protein
MYILQKRNLQSLSDMENSVVLTADTLTCVPTRNNNPGQTSKILPSVSPFHEVNASVEAALKRFCAERKISIYRQPRVNANKGSGHSVAL